MPKPNCPLCDRDGTHFFKDRRTYFQCTHCSGVYVAPSQWPGRRMEKARYETHNNDVNDPGYQEFVRPITKHVLRHFKPKHQGLDYGAGPGPVITKLLGQRGYKLDIYDPFYAPESLTLKKKRDYIVCCEVIEHFHHPSEEFELLRNLLNPNGQLVCMTDLYHEALNFDKWYYKNDETHVFFYHERSLEYIKEAFGFTDLHVDGRLIVFSA